MATRENIEPLARLIASLAENMRDRDWASDILDSCARIEKAVGEIKTIAASRVGGER